MKLLNQMVDTYLVVFSLRNCLVTSIYIYIVDILLNLASGSVVVVLV